MAISRLDEMRRRLKEQESRTQGGDQLAYPFWKIPDNNSVTLRFLPDGDENNPWFWAETVTFRWTFTDPSMGSTIEVKSPCRNSWAPRTCPIVRELSGWYQTKDPDQEKRASAFWPKRSYIYQGLVRKSSFAEQEPPENPVRILLVNKTIHAYVKSSILDTDPDTSLGEMPYDYDRGRDLVVRKDRNGKYADYSAQWSNRETALTDHEKALLAQHGLNKLGERLPKPLSADALRAQEEMFLACSRGEPWQARWEQYFRPWRGQIEREAPSSVPDEVDASRQVEQPSTALATQAALERLKALRERLGARA